MSRSKTQKHPKPMLGELIRIHRSLHRYGTRGLSKQIGLSHSTLARVEKGEPMDGVTQIKIINWLLGYTP
jgi:hypothetical protein